MTAKAKIFQNGRSQAVRLPKEFRFEGQEVYIYKDGDRVVLAPVHTRTWPEGFWDLFGPDPDFQTPESLPTEYVDLDR